MRRGYWLTRSGLGQECHCSIKPLHQLKLCNGVQTTGNHVYALTSRQCMDVYQFVWTCFGKGVFWPNGIYGLLLYLPLREAGRTSRSSSPALQNPTFKTGLGRMKVKMFQLDVQWWHPCVARNGSSDDCWSPTRADNSSSIPPSSLLAHRDRRTSSMLHVFVVLSCGEDRSVHQV